jgi:hypothetical protein
VLESPSSGDLDAGNTVVLTVNFDNAVYVTGTPYLKLNDGGRAIYAGGSGTNQLTFTYVVAAGQNTPGLAVTGPSSAAAFKDIAGNVADLSAISLPGTLQIDTIAPRIASIVTSGAGITVGSGDLGPGNVVTLTMNFTESVRVNTGGGTPRLILNNGGTATYTGGSGSNALTFAYTVGALGSGENIVDLRLAATNALSLNGATIADDAGNAAIRTAANNYNPAGTLQIDTTAPALTKVLVSPTGGEVITGHAVKITLDTNEAVTVSGAPVLLLNDGGTASYDAVHSTATALVFNTTVAAAEVTTDLVVSGIQLPSTASIADLAGNNASLSGAGANLGLRINTTSTGTAGPSGGNFTIRESNELELFGASTANVTFAPRDTGILWLDASSQFKGVVAGLAPGNSLDLADIAFGTGTSLVYSSTGDKTAGSLSANDGSHNANIALLGQYMASSFVMASDGHGGTLITDPPMSQTQILSQSHG